MIGVAHFRRGPRCRRSPHASAVIDGVAPESDLGHSHSTRITVRIKPAVDLVLNEGAEEEMTVGLTPEEARRLAAVLVSAAAASRTRRLSTGSAWSPPPRRNESEDRARRALPPARITTLLAPMFTQP